MENLKNTTQIVVIDCKQALDNGLSHITIIKHVERCLDSEYFQDYDSWGSAEFPYLKLLQGPMGRRISGSMKTTTYNILLDWYQLKSEPSDIQIKLLQPTKFNEELL